MTDRSDFLDSFEGVMKLTAFMRSPEGCPWDREQTHESLKAGLIEECYELVEAIESAAAASVAEELGDLAINLAFHVRIAEESGEFARENVFGGLIDKIVRRHPHVFGDAEADSPEDVKRQWEAIKISERSKDGRSSLDGVPRSMPALAYAQSVQERAARLGFDWTNVDGVLDKVAEEVSELKTADSDAEREAELGDILYSIVNAARWMGLDAEAALRGANARFHSRFGAMEQSAKGRGLSLSDVPMDEKEALWEASKRAEHSTPGNTDGTAER